MPLFNNPPPLNVKSQNTISSQKGQKIQLKKRAPSIKLQVNKLVKPQSQHNYSTKNYHSQHPSHHISNQSFDPNQSMEKQIQTQHKHSKLMNFQELYFKKIKQLHQKQNILDYNQAKPISNPIFIEKQVKIPVSCKNTQSTKNKYKVVLTKHGQSTKNKENLLIINARISSTTPPKYPESKFFKKPLQLQNNLTIFYRSDSIQKNRKEYKNEIQKGKKVLRLKRTNGRTKSDFTLNTSLEKQPNYFVDRNSLSKIQKPSFSPVNERPNISQDMNKIRISTPSQSSVSKYQSMDQATKNSIKQIIERNIDHSKHEHVWSGVECFFSFQEFKTILCGLGFDGKNDQYVQFYVKTLWQHLGGDLYGGVVKKNMVEFLSIVFEDDNHSFKQDDIVNQQKIQSPLPRDFVESSSLRLIKFNGQLRDQLRTFYFPLRMRKIALKFDDKNCNDFIPSNPKNSPNLSGKSQSFNGQRNIELTRFEAKEASNQKIKENGGSPLLQNNAYLDSVSVRNRQPQVSPCMIPKTDSPDSYENPTNVTDFSPKLSKQQYEPFQQFQSTVLPKQICKEKLPTEISPQNQTEFKSNRKALLSVDVSLGEGTIEKIVIYQGQDPYEVSLQLKQRYNIDEQLRQKFQSLLKNHLKTLLFKIDQVSEQLFEDSLELKDHQNSTDFIVMDEEQSI